MSFLPTDLRRSFAFGACLGRGGFGEVYRATMRSPGGLQTEIAVKLLRGDLSLDADAVRRLRDEGRMLARLHHPSVIQVVDLCRIDGRVALITEHVEGVDLVQVLRGEQALSPRAVAEAGIAVADALAAAWKSLMLVHRDIKPTNIRLGRFGVVKLLDFGIARTEAIEREARTASDLVVGSVPYMAPERFTERSCNPSSDVFSLGCTLYEAWVGERFYRKPLMRDVSSLALDSERFRAYAAERLALVQVASGARDLLAEMLAFDPERRPAARQVAAEIERWINLLPGPTLRAWSREYHWMPVAVTRGPLEGAERVEEPSEATKKKDETPPLLPGVVRGAHLGGIASVADGEAIPILSRRFRLGVALLGFGVGVALLAAIAGGLVLLARRETPSAPQIAGVVESTDAPSKALGAGAAASAKTTAPPPPRETGAAGSAKARAGASAAGRAESPAEPMAAAPPMAAGHGRVRLRAAVPVELRRGDRRLDLSQPIPQGVYQLYADTGAGWRPAANITVADGETLTLTCDGTPLACIEAQR